MHSLIKGGSKIVLASLVLCFLLVFILPSPSLVHAGQNVECYEYYGRLVPEGTDLSDRSEYVLVNIIQNEDDPANPTIVCEEDAEVEGVKVGIAQWGITAGSLFGNPGHRGIHTYDAWSPGTNYFAFYNYYYQDGERVTGEYAYLYDDLTANIMPVAEEEVVNTFVEDPRNIKPTQLDPTKNQEDPDVGTNPDDAVTGVDEEVETQDEETCESKAGPLGWILCKVVDFFAETITTIIDQQLADLLYVDELTGEGSETIENAADSIRGIANVLFVIMFIGLIFAQLFGDGQ